jgi:BirA family biotin operon repressor/biotin-[acetyl-CoA-carboxylase] ligase
MRCKADYRLIRLESVASTNDEVLVRAQQLGEGALRAEGGRFVPLVVMSGRQTAGRGRLGRTWVSPPGGLYLSALVELAAQDERDRSHDRSPGAPASLSLVAALAVRDALQGFAPDGLRVKWPNDIMAAGGKLVGVSIEIKQAVVVFSARALSGAEDATGLVQAVESARPTGLARPTRAPTSSYAIIGVGVNANRPDEGAFEGAAYLSDAATGPLPLEELADRIISTLLCRYEDWAAARGSFAPFVEEYRAHMTLLGEPVCVRDAMGAQIACGVVAGVDERGQLLLTDECGLVAVAAGEVTLRGAP